MDPQSLEHHLDGLQRSSVSNLSTIAQENELAMPRLPCRWALFSVPSCGSKTNAGQSTWLRLFATVTPEFKVSTVE